MNVIRIRKQIDSETLHLPELKEMIGKNVEIILLEETPTPRVLTETMETFTASAPKEQTLGPEELAAMRADPKYQRFWPLLEVAGQELIDVNAIVQLRLASMI